MLFWDGCVKKREDEVKHLKSMNKKLGSLNTAGRLMVVSLMIVALGISGAAGISAWQPKQASAYSGASICGKNFSLIYMHYLRDWDRSYRSFTDARLEVYRNPYTKNVCNLVMSTGSLYGVSKYTRGYIGNQYGRIIDSSGGYFRYYAGPNYMPYFDDSTYIKNYGQVNVGGRTYSYNIQMPIRDIIAAYQRGGAWY
jgi:hypothetical protein